MATDPFTHELIIKTDGKEFKANMEFNTDKEDTHQFIDYSRCNQTQIKTLENFIGAFSALFRDFGELKSVTLEPIV